MASIISTLLNKDVEDVRCRKGACCHGRVPNVEWSGNRPNSAQHGQSWRRRVDGDPEATLQCEVPGGMGRDDARVNRLYSR
ncbi:MAG: hypothetical protein EOO65_03605 [Methanosarcinales archaeon]|nr:MAG: hypothetical protein EOO65_03605 [Methanosarcinales archaeon]